MNQTERWTALDAEARAEVVLRLVEAIPPGRAVSYGQIARIVGTGPRQIGAVLATWGQEVCWWRVVNARGSLVPGLVDLALSHWLDEGMTAPGASRVDLTRVGVDDSFLAEAFHAIMAILPGESRKDSLPR